MSDSEKVAVPDTAVAKTDWIKPEIVSFVPATDAKGNAGERSTDGGIANMS